MSPSRAANAADSLPDEITSYWKANLAPYLVDPASLRSRPVARIVRALLDLRDGDEAAACALVSGYVKEMTGEELVSFQPRDVLVVASESGVWASELTIPASLMLAAGYRVTVATETGAPPHFLSVSCDASFVDGSLGIPVVSPEEAELAARFQDPATSEGRLLAPAAIFNLATLGRPPIVADYLVDADRVLSELRRDMEMVCDVARTFDSVLIAGGSGAVPGLAMNGGLHHLILAAHRLAKPIVAQCNGVFALVQTIDPRTDRSILAGRFATTHSKSHEYRRGGWGWAKAGADGQETWTIPGADGNPIIDSEPMVRNAVGDTGAFISPPATAYAVAVDDHIITARTTPDGAPATAALIAALEIPGRRGRWFACDDTGFAPADDLSIWSGITGGTSPGEGGRTGTPEGGADLRNGAPTG